MNILTQTTMLVKNNFLPHVTPKHKGLFEFGVKALSLTSFTSLNSNARKTVQNPNTAHSKIYRLVSNPNMHTNFFSILPHTSLVKKHSKVNVDFSTFCGFETLAFGVQTGKGRAIPIWHDCLTYPIQKPTSQNIFIIDQIKAFGKALGFYPALVFDRGFMIPAVVEFMLSEKITFYLRIKAGKHVELGEKSLSSKQVKQNDCIVLVYGEKLRLIRSNDPGNGNEPWYILTNDFGSEREEIIQIYHCRFEIEEVFKDQKHLFDVKNLLIKKKESFRILLWFVTLAFWIAWLTGLIKNYLAQRATMHKKKRLSWIKLWFEDLTRQRKQIVYKQVGWDPG